MFDPARVKKLNTSSYAGGDVLYWTEGSLRTQWNFALEYAFQESEELGAELLVVATVDEDYEHENLRQLRFLMESLKNLEATYQDLSIAFEVLLGKSCTLLKKYIQKKDIGLLVVSGCYTRYFSEIQKSLASSLDIPVILVDDNCLMPAWYVSDKEEYAAYTLRKKYWNIFSGWARESSCEIKNQQKKDTKVSGIVSICESDWYKDRLIEIEELSDGEDNLFPGGEQVVQERWKEFSSDALSEYPDARNDPNKEATSLLSPYLHFGCISPVQLYWECFDRFGEDTNSHSFVEELIIRREIAINMWHYNDYADSWKCLPDWAIKTLDEQVQWRREGLDHRGEGGIQMSLASDSDSNSNSNSNIREYSYEDLAHGRTKDDLWNAAQNQLRTTGKIHGYVRMYWGKQLIYWFDDWREAYAVAVRLNDQFAIDGASPNGYTGIAWCFGKHDRPFPPKKSHYGIIRSMKLSGMKKKFDVQAYIDRWL